MNEYKKLAFFSFILIFAIAIVLLILSWPLITGKTYILKTMPIDPFDILRGQYMSIRYDISTISNSGLSQEDAGKTIYIILSKNNSIWEYSGFSFEKPLNGDFIKGKISRVSGNNAQIEYGIEQYFFERNARIDARNMRVEVKASSSGQSRISKLLDEYNKEIIIDYSDE
jgi:uncharacterized membrane-anchored protein